MSKTKPKCGVKVPWLSRVAVGEMAAGFVYSYMNDCGFLPTRDDALVVADQACLIMPGLTVEQWCEAVHNESLKHMN